MATITLKGNEIHTSGELPGVGDTAPDFSLTAQDMSDKTLQSYAGQKKILSIVPSLDTPVCATSTRVFNEKAGTIDGVVVLTVSADLPFAMKRFCTTEGIEGVEALSTFRSDFAKDYGIEITDGPLRGVTGRAVLVIDENNKVIHSELVPEIAQEPNYDAALAKVS